MTKVEHYGYYKKGRWHMDSFVHALRSLKDVPVVLTVDEFKEKRGSQANKYYWKVVLGSIGVGLKDAGWEPNKCSKEAVHEMLKREFLTVDEHLKDGVFLKRTRSTTELDSQEFSEYLEHCIRFAAEYLNVQIPPPGEQMEIAA